MNLTDQEKERMSKFPGSDIYRIIQKIVHSIVERSWKMRKRGATADETHGLVSYGEGMEAGAMEVINILNKLSK